MLESQGVTGKDKFKGNHHEVHEDHGEKKIKGTNPVASRLIRGGGMLGGANFVGEIDGVDPRPAKLTAEC